MRIPLLIVFALMASCVRTRTIIPNTPEGMSCVRECMIIRNQCIGSGTAPIGCRVQFDDCLRTCPGAYDQRENSDGSVTGSPASGPTADEVAQERDAARRDACENKLRQEMNSCRDDCGPGNGDCLIACNEAYSKNEPSCR